MTAVLAGALGLVVGLVIGALGGGGGVLAVPALVYLLGQDARTATTGSIVVVGLIAAAGTLARLRGGTVDRRTGLVFGAVGVPTAWAGSVLNRVVPQPVLLGGFAVLTVTVAVLMLLGHREGATGPDGPDGPDGRAGGAPPAAGRSGPGAATAVTLRRTAAGRAVRVVAAGAVVGFLTGFLGVGGGFLVVPALTLVLGLPMPVAIGTSLLVITLNSVSSLAARAGHLQLDWAVLAPFAGVAVVAALAATLVADRLSSTVLNRAFAVLLLLVGGFVGVQGLLASGIG